MMSALSGIDIALWDLKGITFYFSVFRSPRGLSVMGPARRGDQ